MSSGLDGRSLVLTPHLTKLASSPESATPLRDCLFVGAYNLGFAAVRDCAQGSALLEWWCDRVADEGFADRIDALHVDQKWMDLVPGFLGDGVLVPRDPGLNAAQWNMHERQLTMTNGTYFMDDRPLVFSTTRRSTRITRSGSPNARRSSLWRTALSTARW